jgi:glycosyltransferase involved in cell wall biosynthesis
MKGHETFLRAARMMLDAGADATFVCAGREVVPTNPTLMGLVGELGLGDRVHLLGERDDTARLFAAFDVTCCSSSWGEGFPNVIGESMACGTPCVVTDVGDAPAAVGQTGVVVPPRNPEALGQAILQLLSLAPDLRRDLGDAARRRVQTEFPLPRYGERFAALYRQILSGRRVEYGPRRARTSVPSEAARSTTPSSPGGDR